MLETRKSCASSACPKPTGGLGQASVSWVFDYTHLPWSLFTFFYLQHQKTECSLTLQLSQTQTLDIDVTIQCEGCAFYRFLFSLRGLDLHSDYATQCSNVKLEPYRPTSSLIAANNEFVAVIDLIIIIKFIIIKSMVAVWQSLWTSTFQLTSDFTMAEHSVFKHSISIFLVLGNRMVKC